MRIKEGPNRPNLKLALIVWVRASGIQIRAPENTLHCGASLIEAVEVVGRAGEEEERLPRLQFKYVDFEPGKRRFTGLPTRDLPAVSLAFPTQAWTIYEISSRGKEVQADCG